MFNPVKVTEKKDRVIWSTQSIDLAIDALAQGKRLKANPFLDGNINLLKPDIIFEHTDDEVEQWKYYSTHINEFVEDLCKIMTPKGYDHITLRDYQKEYFSLLHDNRLTIKLSCRQAGKCTDYKELSVFRIPADLWASDARLIKYWQDNYYYFEDIFELPIFEINNLFNRSISWKIQNYLYRKLYKIYAKRIKRNRPEDKRILLEELSKSLPR